MRERSFSVITFLVLLLSLGSIFRILDVSHDVSADSYSGSPTKQDLAPSIASFAEVVAPMKGMTVTAWSAEAYNSSNFDQSITDLADIKANWVTFTVFWFMEKYNDTEIHRRPDLYTSSDSSLIHAIQKAHELNMKVVLKPMVDVVDGTWRGMISPFNWTLWFDSYRDFMNYYADLAEANSVELFTVGTELRSSQSYESEWRQAINETRTRFSQNVTYAANWDSYSTIASLPQYAVGFWDALDYVGVDAYFPLTNSYDPTIQQLMSAWSHAASDWWGTERNWTNDLYLTYNQTGKKIVFTEIGYCSQNGTNTQPWTGFDPPHRIDLQEQADCYQAALEVFKNKTWFMGWFWWNWETDPNAGGPNDNWYPPQNKPAQDVLRQYYYEPDIAVTDVVCSGSFVVEGGVVDIEITVENQGIYAETFNLTTYANTTTIQTQTVSLANGTLTTKTFIWDTNGWTDGNYAISAYAWPIAGEIDTTDNRYVDSMVRIFPPIHDIAITAITLSKEYPEINETTCISITVKNEGNVGETLVVSVNCSQLIDFPIGTQPINLDAGEYAVLNFSWVPSVDGRCQIKAYTSTIPNDINPLDNIITRFVSVLPISWGAGGIRWQVCIT
jgi:hypothetical protein